MSGEDIKTAHSPMIIDGHSVCSEWGQNIKEVLFTSEQLQTRIKELAADVSARYAGKKILAVGLLNGAVVFASDFLRHLTVPYMLDFVSLSSYGHGTTSTGSVKLKKDLSIDPKGQHIVILEDLIDTGNTLAWLTKHLASKEAASVELVCLLDKKARRTTEVQIDLAGFECPDEFVVGFGMDFAEEYRCLPFVAVLKPEAYIKKD